VRPASYQKDHPTERAHAYSCCKNGCRVALGLWSTKRGASDSCAMLVARMPSLLLLWLQQQEDPYAAVHESLLIQFLELIAVPIVVTAMLYLIKVMTAQSKPTKDEVIEVALEFAAVGTVASGSVFANEVIHKHWGEATQGTGLFVFAICAVLMMLLGGAPALVDSAPDPTTISEGAIYWLYALEFGSGSAVRRVFSL
jgi:hypothetical protein